MSWYRQSERDHDYNPEWDYTRDPRPYPKAIQAFESAAKSIRGRLPALFNHSFDNFTLFYTSDDLGTGGDGALAVYANGTYSEPVIIVNSRSITRSHKEINEEFPIHNQISLDYIAYTTLLHELKHAEQEADARDWDEDEAENFAREN